MVLLKHPKHLSAYRKITQAVGWREFCVEAEEGGVYA